MAEDLTDTELRDIRRLFDKFNGGNTGQISADDIVDFMVDELDMTDVPGFKIRHMIEDVTNKETINRREFTEMFLKHKTGEKKYELHGLVMTVKEKIAQGEASRQK